MLVSFHNFGYSQKFAKFVSFSHFSKEIHFQSKTMSQAHIYLLACIFDMIYLMQ